MTQVNTAKVTDRRRPRYSTIDELLADVDRIVAADREGRLRRTGNWTAGQAFGHLASWINFGWDGYPIRPPWFIRFLIRRKKKEYIEGGMPAGVHIPRVPGGTAGTEVLTTDAGADRLRKALARLRSEPPKYDSPAWGPMPVEERIAINLRHAELHLSFLHPE